MARAASTRYDEGHNGELAADDKDGGAQ